MTQKAAVSEKSTTYVLIEPKMYPWGNVDKKVVAHLTGSSKKNQINID
ncbi:hypothetical protein [Desulfotignum phosphitoxidans]|nr:hypothetical protein [Desulfotignum phosphitoxidans]